VVPLWRSVLSGLLIGLRDELAGSIGVYLNKNKNASFIRKTIMVLAI
jgi:hypothetical protein